jgi:hypothetical protein
LIELFQELAVRLHRGQALQPLQRAMPDHFHGRDDRFERFGDHTAREDVEQGRETVDHLHHVIRVREQGPIVGHAHEDDAADTQPRGIEPEHRRLFGDGPRDQSTAAVAHDVDVERRARRQLPHQPFHVAMRVMRQREMVEGEHPAIVPIGPGLEGGWARSARTRRAQY